MESEELQQGQIVTGDRVAVEVSREIVEVKEWQKVHGKQDHSLN